MAICQSRFLRACVCVSVGTAERGGEDFYVFYAYQAAFPHGAVGG